MMVGFNLHPITFRIYKGDKICCCLKFASNSLFVEIARQLRRVGRKLKYYVF